jgi:glyoxylase-like metal-dependent hydrolase (beta-lactamase superfamily II)
MGSIGRTDLWGGDEVEMRESLKRVAALPPKTRIYPGHGPVTDLKSELARNPYLKMLGDDRGVAN